MKSMKTNTALATAALVGIAASVAWGLWTSDPVTAYSAATLAAASARTDTVVVSDAARQDKPDEYLLELTGTSSAAATDSQFFATVRKLKDGVLTDIGEDSLTLRPRLASGVQVAELRVIRWVADSLVVVTRNPKSTTVTGAAFSAQARRLP